MLLTPSAFPPASKVSATTLVWVGITSHTLPPKPCGTCSVWYVFVASAGPAGVSGMSVIVPTATADAAKASCYPVFILAFIVITTLANKIPYSYRIAGRPGRAGAVGPASFRVGHQFPVLAR